MRPNLILDLQNDCIIHKLTWLCNNKVPRKNKPVFTETRVAEHPPITILHLALTSRRQCNVTSTFNLTYQPVGLEGKQKLELYICELP